MDNSERARARAAEILEKAYSEVEMRILEGGFKSFDEYEIERKRIRKYCADQGVGSRVLPCALFMHFHILFIYL